MSATKKPTKTPEELQTVLQNMIAQGRKEGMIRASELNAQLEQLDLSPEKIEEIYDQFEAMNNEGDPVARWLARRGITAVVLKYRLPNTHSDVPINDALAAIEYVRTHATELNVNPAEVGIAGFSAGGHLAASASTRYTSAANRPDFSILVYPVITMTKLTHGGSRDALLGKEASEELIKKYSCENNVNAQTPPTFLVHCNDDGVVPVENALMYAESLRAHKVPHVLHIYPNGGHGWGFMEGPGRLETWRPEFYNSLQNWLNLINK